MWKRRRAMLMMSFVCAFVVVVVVVMVRIGGRRRMWWQRGEWWNGMDHVRMQAHVGRRCIWRQWQLRQHGIELVHVLLNACCSTCSYCSCIVQLLILM